MPQLDRQTGCTKAGVAAQRGLGSVAVIVPHADVAIPNLLEEDDAVCPDAGATGGERSDSVDIFQVGGASIGRIENDEVVPGSRHFIEVLARWAR